MGLFCGEFRRFLASHPLAQCQHQQCAADVGHPVQRGRDDGQALVVDRAELGHPGPLVWVGEDRVGDQHAASNPAQQHAAGHDDHGVALHQLDDQLRAPDDDRDRDQQTQDDEQHLVLARALGGAGNGDHVVHRHYQVGDDDGLDGGKQLVAALDVVVALFFRGDQLHTDPEQQDGAHHLEERQLQQHHREGDQDDAQDNGASRAINNAFAALFGRQLAAGQRDHNGVVTAEQDVDDDDLAESDPEWCVCEEIQIHEGTWLKTLQSSNSGLVRGFGSDMTWLLRVSHGGAASKDPSCGTEGFQRSCSVYEGHTPNAPEAVRLRTDDALLVCRAAVGGVQTGATPLRQPVLEHKKPVKTQKILARALEFSRFVSY